MTNHTISWTKQTFFIWCGMSLSSEPGEMEGLSFKGVILWFKGSWLRKWQKSSVWETWQQGIAHVSSKSWFFFLFVFLLLLKLALCILRSYLRGKTPKKSVDINQEILHETSRGFFSSLLFWLWPRCLTCKAAWYFVHQNTSKFFGQRLYSDLRAGFTVVSTMSPANSTFLIGAGSIPALFKALTPRWRRSWTGIFAGQLACGMLGLAHSHPAHSSRVPTCSCTCDRALPLQSPCLHANSRAGR